MDGLPILKGHQSVNFAARFWDQLPEQVPTDRMQAVLNRLAKGAEDPVCCNTRVLDPNDLAEVRRALHRPDRARGPSGSLRQSIGRLGSFAGRD